MKWFANFLYKQKLKKVTRNVKTHNFETAKTALLLYDCATPEKEKEGREFARFLKEQSISVTSISYFPKKGKNISKPKDELTYHYLHYKDLNWLKIPTNAMVNKVLLKQFDLLIDLNLEGHFALQYISAFCHASCKVGPAIDYQNEVCDLTFRFNTLSRTALIKEIKKYLAIINKKSA